MARDPRANSFSCILPSFLMRWFKFCFTLCSEFASSFLIVVQNDLNILHRYSIKMFYFLLMLLSLNSFSYLTLVIKWMDGLLTCGACWKKGPLNKHSPWMPASESHLWKHNGWGERNAESASGRCCPAFLGRIIFYICFSVPVYDQFIWHTVRFPALPKMCPQGF